MQWGVNGCCPPFCEKWRLLLLKLSNCFYCFLICQTSKNLDQLKKNLLGHVRLRLSIAVGDLSSKSVCIVCFCLQCCVRVKEKCFCKYALLIWPGVLHSETSASWLRCQRVYRNVKGCTNLEELLSVIGWSVMFWFKTALFYKSRKLCLIE